MKVRFGNFLDALNHHNTLSKKTLEYSEKVNKLRKEADEIILQIWNEVEKTHSTHPEDSRKGSVKRMVLFTSTEKTRLKRTIFRRLWNRQCNNYNPGKLSVSGFSFLSSMLPALTWQV